tara:strand:- start:136 stop:945 length:810 start_codon:yes stop_codon:yes gene_type:complete
MSELLQFGLNKARVWRVLFLATMVGGCSGAAVVPVSDLTAARTTPSVRIVRGGDSLYTIAWESGLDYRDVALWNGLEPPYRLQVGQEIILGPIERKTSSVSVSAGVMEASSEPLVSEQTPVVVEPVEVRSEGSKVMESGNTDASSSVDGIWLWPATGNLVTRFDLEAGSNGIDISGIDGSPVRAAAKGKVVYAGTGLRGYGLLIIIKHDETFLSAYAHNRAVKIKEGDTVHRGQIIAEMGQSGAASTRLHFEIRRDGQPVDPLQYLPEL